MEVTLTTSERGEWDPSKILILAKVSWSKVSVYVQFYCAHDFQSRLPGNDRFVNFKVYIFLRFRSIFMKLSDIFIQDFDLGLSTKIFDLSTIFRPQINAVRFYLSDLQPCNC